MTKTIKVSNKTHERLAKRHVFGKTLESVIIGLLDFADQDEKNRKVSKH